MTAGRPTSYKPAFVKQAEKLCILGATDMELADFFGVTARTINRWANKHENFCLALRAGKEVCDDRVERALYHRAVGYTHEATKIFMPAGREEPVYAPYLEHVPPDPGSIKMWLCNRRGDVWRDKIESTVTFDVGERFGQLIAEMDRRRIEAGSIPGELIADD